MLNMKGHNGAIFIGLGSNVGDKEATLNAAVEKLRNIAEIKKISSVYETEPMEYENQEWFLNMAVEMATALQPHALLKQLHRIEESLGRTREIRYGPRTMDLDILLYDDAILREKDLIIPHPKMRERAFVLVPLREIASDIIHPIYKKSIKTLLKQLFNNYAIRLWTPQK
jgi:2-amino-4-hydroxy-6-hydroxymethyldihydropteridine diphosphokinase